MEERSGGEERSEGVWRRGVKESGGEEWRREEKESGGGVKACGGEE